MKVSILTQTLHTHTHVNPHLPVLMGELKTKDPSSGRIDPWQHAHFSLWKSSNDTFLALIYYILFNKKEQTQEDKGFDINIHLWLLHFFLHHRATVWAMFLIRKFSMATVAVWKVYIWGNQKCGNNMAFNFTGISNMRTKMLQRNHKARSSVIAVIFRCALRISDAFSVGKVSSRIESPT